MGSYQSEGAEYLPFKKPKSLRPAEQNGKKGNSESGDLPKVELERFVSHFSVENIVETGFLEIALKIAKQLPLSETDCIHLLRAPLPILAILVKIFCATRDSSFKKGNSVFFKI